MGMAVLQLYSDYDRREVHDIFDPDARFTPQAGTWGLHGIIPIKDRPGDFVLFVTFGQAQGEHNFDEGVSFDGVLRWQSQPKQTLQDPQIRQFIGHDETKNQVYLFLRTADRDRKGPKPYTYLGRLKYLTHDVERERPVHFAWQLLDWPIPQHVRERIGLPLESFEKATPPKPSDAHAGLIATLPPTPKPAKLGSSTRAFKTRLNVSTAVSDERKRDLGLAGELAMVDYERRRLQALGLDALADQVRHVSIVEGDGAGFDILSFREDGTKLYIEVKTTTGAAASEFFMSSNEVAFSTTHPNDYELRRVYDFNETSKTGRFFLIIGDVTEQLLLTATQFRASISQQGN